MGIMIIINVGVISWAFDKRGIGVQMSWVECHSNSEGIIVKNMEIQPVWWFVPVCL
jgi:hypothetical protein